ncbi:HET domain-containing protein [Fusarium keratoplasticum]|uniref:HET domain-containing protein n=1 Tax=Fusarium keratoplasticum TaxID=1328300 RepID=A0ACC0QRR0_9HYPO|nr:HET domain-containing protein [Fusarium keratoplasticum]KAI8665948.1 HET domain-containing protein [Fusarium keratoplasticum]
MAQGGQIEKLLRELGLPLKQDAKARQTQLLTLDSPHSCEHCRDDFVQVAEEHDTINCSKCRWSGTGTATSPEYRSCGGCGKLYRNNVTRKFSGTLKGRLRDAVAAAGSGCLLYAYFLASVDHLHLFAHDLERHCGGDAVESLLSIATLHLSGISFAQEGVSAPCVFTLHLRAGSFKKLQQAGGGIGSERINLADIPSRLLDVQAGAGRHIKLIKFDTLSDIEQAMFCSSGFAALSYCWGGQQSFTLTRSQSQHLYDGFSPSELPKTIQDAIRVTRELGLRYLWVDALCIQQDSDQDKAAEISRMETYYGSATVTICAAAASTAEQGFLFRRKNHPFDAGPFRIRLRNKNGIDEGYIYLLKEGDGPPNPTTTRGWTMQESFLSRRILIYSERQLYWTCTTSMCGCGGSFMSMAERVSGNYMSLVKYIQPIGDLIYLPTANQWQDLLMNYTTRHIGVPGDKLLAISALVAHLWNISKDRREKPAYIAGLFVNLAKSASFLEQLRWNAIDPAKSRRASVYRAPSWSWAAIDGPIQNHLSGGYPPVIRQPDQAVIHSYSVDLVHQNLPFGSVRDAHIIIEAKKRRLCECTNVPGLPLIIRPRRPDDDNPDTSIDLHPDTEEDSQAIREIIQNKGTSGGDIFLLLLRKSRGLIVSPTASGDMVRIGVFEMYKKGEDEFDPGIVFDKCVPTSMRLV